ncbi:unnamed protein product [Amoebophrya sp. A25]|nr:unnamed protein product [Amoebophrya sp. A25]|eukprot:GSA25T00012264001.1
MLRSKMMRFALAGATVDCCSIPQHRQQRFSVWRILTGYVFLVEIANYSFSVYKSYLGVDEDESRGRRRIRISDESGEFSTTSSTCGHDRGFRNDDTSARSRAPQDSGGHSRHACTTATSTTSISRKMASTPSRAVKLLPRSIFLPFLPLGAQAIFIDYDCAFGSYTYDWTKIYDMVMKEYLGSGRTSMEIPNFVSQNVVNLLSKGKRECPLGAMQIAIMFYYYTLRDYEVSVLKLVAGVRREVLQWVASRSSDEPLPVDLPRFSASEGIARIKEDLAAVTETKRRLIAHGKGLDNTNLDDKKLLLLPDSELPDGKLLDALLEPEWSPEIKISKVTMSESTTTTSTSSEGVSVAADGSITEEENALVKADRTKRIHEEHSPTMWRRGLMQELKRRPRRRQSYLDGVDALLKYVETKAGTVWGKFVEEVAAAGQKSTVESASASTASSSADKLEKSEALELFYFLAHSLDRYYDPVTADPQLVPEDLDSKLKILLLILEELPQLDSANELQYGRRHSLLTNVFTFAREENKQHSHTPAGIRLRHAIRGNSTRPMRGSNYEVGLQLQEPELDFIDSEFEWQLNEEVLSNLGSLDPDELEWVEVDTSSHITAPPLMFRRLYPNVNPNFDHEAGLAAEAKKAARLNDISFNHLSFALRSLSNKFLVSLAEFHPLIAQCVREIRYYSDLIQVMLQEYSVTILAESRWPIFEALTLSQPYHAVSKEFLCTEASSDGLLDWASVRIKMQEWSQVKSLKIQYPDSEEIDEVNLELERYTAEMVQATLGSKQMHAQSEVECPLALMLVACIEIASAANRYTEYVPNFEAPVNMMFETLNWQRISAAGWPIWQTLVYYSDINKGEFLFSGDKKYARKFLDLDLRENELNLYDYEKQQFGDLQALRTAPSLGVWGGHVRAILMRKMNEEGFQLRPIFVSLLNAIAISLGFEKLLETGRPEEEGDKEDADEEGRPKREAHVLGSQNAVNKGSQGGDAASSSDEPAVMLNDFYWCGDFFDEYYVEALHKRESMRKIGSGAQHIVKQIDNKVAGYDKLIGENMLARDYVKLYGEREQKSGGASGTKLLEYRNHFTPAEGEAPMPLVLKEQDVLGDQKDLLNFLFQQEFGLECASSGTTDRECILSRGCCIARPDPRKKSPAYSRGPGADSEDQSQTPPEQTGDGKTRKSIQPNQSKQNWSTEEARFIDNTEEGDYSGLRFTHTTLPQPKCLHHPSTRIVNPLNQARPQYSPVGAVFEKDLADGRADVDSQSGKAIVRTGRRLVLVTLLYGQNWSEVLPIMLSRIYGQLQLPYPMVVVSVGETAYTTCLKFQTYGQVGCWQPKTPSQVHRFTIMFFLLQLGLELLYFDMDTYAVQDFVTPIVEYADHHNHDILFPQHPDGPCINIGLFYIRPTILTLQWFHDFLEWYHSYPYEVDQRGLDALTYANSTLKVSHQPKRVDMELARPYWVDSLRTYVMMAKRGPWMGEHHEVKFIHWFSRTFEDKFPEMQIAYNAGDKAAQEGLSLSQAMRLVKQFPQLAEAHGNFRDVQLLMEVMNVYKVEEIPDKPKCW